MMKKVSIKDIAKLAGVAPSTVSFVLNGKAKQMRISDGLAASIVDVAKSKGYHPNHLAVSLRTGKSRIIGLVVESISGHFFGALAKIIEGAVEEFNYKVIYCSTENDSQKGHELIRMLSQRQVDGYIITPTPGMEKDINQLRENNIPVVLVDSYFPGSGIPYVTVDNYGGVQKGMKLFLDKGYSNIGFITVNLPLIQVRERERAYYKFLKDNSFPEQKNLVLQIDYNLPREEVVRCIVEYFHNNPGLQAIFFATNYLGIAGLESIKQLGLSIPDDLAIICFDDHDIFRLYPPGITVIRQPVEEIATTAVALLLGQLEEINSTATTGKNLHVPGKLIIRGSV